MPWSSLFDKKQPGSKWNLTPVLILSHWHLQQIPSNTRDLFLSCSRVEGARQGRKCLSLLIPKALSILNPSWATATLTLPFGGWSSRFGLTAHFQRLSRDVVLHFDLHVLGFQSGHMQLLQEIWHAYQDTEEAGQAAVMISLSTWHKLESSLGRGSLSKRRKCLCKTVHLENMWGHFLD